VKKTGRDPREIKSGTMVMRNALSLFYLFVLILLMFSSGCAALAISAAGAGAGIGIPYVFSDCADRTMNFSFDQVDRATPKVLKKLDIDLLMETELENGKRIKASTDNLEILIDMEKVTMRATRVIINAKKGNLIKDRATAEEIINQLEKSLATHKTPVFEKSPVREKSRPREKSMTRNEPIRSAGPTLVGFQEGFQ
jgi:6-pyruvoyl-tetrahydropterin synthase